MSCTDEMRWKPRARTKPTENLLVPGAGWLILIRRAGTRETSFLRLSAFNSEQFKTSTTEDGRSFLLRLITRFRSSGHRNAANPIEQFVRCSEETVPLRLLRGPK